MQVVALEVQVVLVALVDLLVEQVALVAKVKAKEDPREVNSNSKNPRKISD